MRHVKYCADPTSSLVRKRRCRGRHAQPLAQWFSTGGPQLGILMHKCVIARNSVNHGPLCILKKGLHAE